MCHISSSVFDPFLTILKLSRHGARIDAVDRQWHLTSATPYDPPLTYGGWKQSQVLGERIANILHSRDSIANSHVEHGELKHPSVAALENNHETYLHSELKSGQPRRRKQRLVIHSSPFLRCIQTSIAIGAGLEQYEAKQKPPSLPQNLKPHYPPHPMHSGSPHIRARDHWNSPHLSAIHEPEEGETEDSQTPSPKLHNHSRSRLRLDAFLGEWLSPEYFEMITTPPDSVMMIAGAKADLLRLKQLDTAKTPIKHVLGRGNFPGGWESNNSHENGILKEDDGPLGKMDDLSQSLPRFSRSNSHNSYSHPNNRMHHDTPKPENIARSESTGYMPPVPAYAISPADAIPAGYVAHARDACIDVDYQWDSMRMPHDWGDGGKVGEEWSSMHKRFRRGLQSMINWYRDCDTEKRKAFLKEEGLNGNEQTYQADEETETIIVIVTHGAGCNALIGALSNQPVLLDVGMASLTMAVRKDGDKSDLSSPEASPPLRRRSVIDTGVSDDYRVKMIASTEHLRRPPRASNVSSLQQSPTISSPFNSSQRYGSGSAISTASSNSTLNASFHLDDLDAGDKTLKKSATTSGGLWSKPVAKIELNADHEIQDRKAQPLLRKFKVRPFIPDEDVENRTPTDSQADKIPEVDDSGRFATQGLWGTPPQALGTAREKGVKRRWTHSEHR